MAASTAGSVGSDSIGGVGQGWNSNIALSVFWPSRVAVGGGLPLPVQATRCAVALTTWLTFQNLGTPSALAGHQSQRTVRIGTSCVMTTLSAMLEVDEPSPTDVLLRIIVMPV